MGKQSLAPAERQRRKREKVAVVLIAVLLAVFTAIEIHLLKTSAELPFVNSIFFFGLMNLNIILVMLLLFLVFRNVVKLVLDERRQKTGSRLKSRLVFCFILFAIIPTVLLFSISAFYIKSSFDKWFNVKVEGTLQRSIEVVQNYYENSETNASHFARRVATLIASQAPKPEEVSEILRTSRLQYGLDGLEYYSDPFVARRVSTQPDRSAFIPVAPLDMLKRLFDGDNHCQIKNVGGGELIRCGASVGMGKGVVLASVFIPMSLASQLSDINLTYQDYKSSNPLDYPIKSTYFLILLMVTLLILFAATWTGFYVARRLTVPIEQLVRGTSEVARGNLDYQIPVTGNDELYQLIELFNKMTVDLKLNKMHLEETHADLRRINEELRNRRKYIEVLLESVQSAVFSLDPEGRISMVNSAAATLLGLSLEELRGKNYREVFPAQHHEEIQELLEKVYGLAQPVRREMRFLSGEGKWLTLLVTLSALRAKEGQSSGVVVVLDDVTDIQKMERMLAWREVARRIAHEIKNPLTPIQLSVQRLRRRYLDKIHDDGTFNEATRIVLAEVDSLKTLVNEFSSFARLPELQLREDDLNGVVLDAVNLFRAAHEKVRFTLSLAEDLPHLELDRGQLKRVLVNLFDNAVDAMGGEGEIQVVTQPGNQGVELSVIDSGPGLPLGDTSRVFEPYYSTKEGGTGLGLAIVQRIVSDHGGVVEAQRGEAGGALFSIRFPNRLLVGKEGQSVAKLPQPEGQEGEETV